MDAIRVPVHPAFRMFCFAAYLDSKVCVDHLATAWAVPDWGIATPVIQIGAHTSSHYGHFLCRGSFTGGCDCLVDLNECAKSVAQPARFGKRERKRIGYWIDAVEAMWDGGS